jgi:hypothetical protein
VRGRAYVKLAVNELRRQFGLSILKITLRRVYAKGGTFRFYFSLFPFR